MARSILIVEDELLTAKDIRLTVEEAGYIVYGVARSYQSALDMIALNAPDIVILDIVLKGELTGIDLGTQLNRQNIPFVYLSANCNTSILEMAKLTQPSGFLVKPFRDKDLLITLDIAIYRNDSKKQRATLTSGKQTEKGTRTNGKATEAGSPHTLPEQQEGLTGFVGKSQVMREVYELVKEVGPLDTSVLILGESGTGKEGIASNLHQLSPRRHKPFIKLNCAALPPNLVESELFGHERGAFTGALERQIGKFEQADGGTLFLDEIGEMPVAMQVKLLRVLQERELERVGGRETVRVNVRIIAATNNDLEKSIAEGFFRLDLYYRLNVFPVLLPPLRHRKDDIPLLADHFIDIYAARNNRKTKFIAPEAIEQLTAHPWPGNVREFQNVIERSLLLTNDTVLRKIAFMPSLSQARTTPFTETSADVKTIAEMEREHIVSVLQKCRGRVSGSGGAAELLRLPASTLKSKMKKLGIEKNY